MNLSAIPEPMCRWIVYFFLARKQFVRINGREGSPLVSDPVLLTPGAPQGCCLSSMLYSIFTHDYEAKDPSSSLIAEFADDTTLGGMVRSNDETAYRHQVETLESWCSEFNRFLNVSKTK